MAGESQQTPGSEPDPSVLTTEALTRAMRAERDYEDAQRRVLEQRLHAIDRATELLNETANRVPTDVQVAVGHLKELHDERFDSIATQFRERDTRAELRRRDNTKAVDAAFAAQKESAAKQDEANQKAIDKSEKAMTDTISNLAALVTTTTNAIGDKIDDNKARVAALELTVASLQAGQAGGHTAITSSRETQANLRQTVAVAISVVLLMLAVAGLVISLAVKQ